MDYKDWIQDKADEIAVERGYDGFYDLPEDQRDEVYNEAMEAHKDYEASLIDAAYERSKYEAHSH